MTAATVVGKGKAMTKPSMIDTRYLREFGARKGAEGQEETSKLFGLAADEIDRLRAERAAGEVAGSNPADSSWNPASVAPNNADWRAGMFRDQSGKWEMRHDIARRMSQHIRAPAESSAPSAPAQGGLTREQLVKIWREEYVKTEHGDLKHGTTEECFLAVIASISALDAPGWRAQEQESRDA